jgi:hypothetical protein
LLDEWTEVIPSRQETTGVTFHFDRPSTEAPQVMLLVTPPALKGHWKWEDLVEALDETLGLAKMRAKEPRDLADHAQCFLPAILMATTDKDISISTDLTRNNMVPASSTEDDNA